MDSFFTITLYLVGLLFGIWLIVNFIIFYLENKIYRRIIKTKYYVEREKECVLGFINAVQKEELYPIINNIYLEAVEDLDQHYNQIDKTREELFCFKRILFRKIGDTSFIGKMINLYTDFSYPFKKLQKVKDCIGV